ncbi:MAG: DUF4886 domain-containing protein [Bacteroides sp.]|jgi:hypothetical protein|nr:DUF4886 domain-containing protein [Bacteroides sp.]MCI1681339.1 DUF4886 domain-containing protein [Bacteroides sp.]
MFKKNLLLTVFLFIVISIHASDNDTIRVLTIGNSFSEDAVENNLYDLGKTDNIVFIIGNMFIGGCSLEKHWNNATNNNAVYSYRKINAKGIKTVTANEKLSEAIADEKWDYISLQQNSGNSGIIESYFPYLSNLLSYVKAHATNPKVKYVFHETWAYQSNSTHKDFGKYDKSQTVMYKAIIKSVKQATKKVGIHIIIPSGTAIQNGRNSSIGDHFCRDTYHLSLGLGRYTAACTWFERLSGKSVIGNQFIPSNVSAEQAKIAQKAAHYAIKRPYKITPIF